MYEINPRLGGFQCIRCGTRFPVAAYSAGCPLCFAADYPASVAPVYEGAQPPPRSGVRGMARFADRLPYRTFPSLGEGDTPLIELPTLARELGIERLLVKFEGAQITGSHKDRMSAQFIAHACALGAPRVIAASSGNAGVSIAAYAAQARMPCTIVTNTGMQTPWRQALESIGADLVECPDSLSRWQFVREKVETAGWLSATNYLDPPVGSDPSGVDAYKTIAYELGEDPGFSGIDAVLIPTARGDVLWGLFAGFREMQTAGEIKRSPALIAVEPFARLNRVLAGEDYRGHFDGASMLASIGGVTTTLQSLLAVRETQGTAITVSESNARQDQVVLARNGVYLEDSSAAALSALRSLARRDTRVRQAILIGTSHGYKSS
ncbi:MAG: pyridoxal-phosphate dependent enzyme [Proteobacteria bacterium]|nr:pyridoxal-phosphate dependent enzyme [Pseudomonadota bacterium]